MSSEAENKLQQALATRPPEGSPERQLALALPLQDPRTEKLVTTLTTAIAERRSVKLTYVSAARRSAKARPVGAHYQEIMRAPLVLLAACGVDSFSESSLVAPTVDDDPTLPGLEVNGTRLHVETFGPAGAPVLVFLHGGFQLFHIFPALAGFGDAIAVEQFKRDLGVTKISRD